MDSIEVTGIVKRLLVCEYPFQWRPREALETIPDDMIGRLTDNLEERIFDDDESQFEKYTSKFQWSIKTIAYFFPWSYGKTVILP